MCEPWIEVGGIEGRVGEVLEVAKEEAAEARAVDDLLNVLVACQRGSGCLGKHEIPVPRDGADAAVRGGGHVEIEIMRITDVRDRARWLRVDIADAEERHHGKDPHPFVDIHEGFDGLFEGKGLIRCTHREAQRAAELDKAGIVIAGEIIEPAEAMAVLSAI